MAQIEKIPPHSDAAEKSVLGSILIDPEAFMKVSEHIKSDDFYSPAHREIYAAMTELVARGENTDLVTVSDCLKKRKALDIAGGRAYVTSLAEDVPTSANAGQYAKIVAEKSMLRKLITTAAEISEKSFEESVDASLILDNAEQNIFNIAQQKQSKGVIKIQDILSENVNTLTELQKNGGQIPGVATGFKLLDDITTGFKKANLVILAARPSVGKSALALNFLQHAALKDKRRVVLFSLEMSAEEIGVRLLSMEARIDSKKLAVGDLDAEDWVEIQNAVERLSAADIIVDVSPGIGPMEIRNKCRRISREKPIDMIIVDYLQIMNADVRSESRQLEVAMFSKFLKQLAREMNCPVIALSQLSREGSKRSEKNQRPVLTDLRDSGAIEQDADVVLLMHRENIDQKEGQAQNNECEIIIAKQRMGMTGSIKLSWVPRYTKFANKEPEIPTPTPPDNQQ